MRAYLVIGTLVIGVMSVSACANHTYAPGPGMSADQLGPDAARCRLFARGTEPGFGFEASGSQKAVAIESGVMLGLGIIGTAVHDSETYDDCMQARGWRVADAGSQSAASTAAVPEPVTQTSLPPPLLTPPTPQTVYDERSQQVARAESVAVAWYAAQRTMNDIGSGKGKDRLYTALCYAGDKSSCLMASALNQPVAR